MELVCIDTPSRHLTKGKVYNGAWCTTDWSKIKVTCDDGIEGAFDYRYFEATTKEGVVERNKYSREIKPGVFVDVYDVLRAFAVTDPCLQHLLKKALAAGVRGHKDTEEDLLDIQASANRAVEMYKEWSDENDAQGSR